MKQRYSILLMLSAACLFSACSNDDDAEETKNPPLVIHVSETPMTNDGALAQAVSHRGAIVNNTNFNTFYMRYGNEDTYSYRVTKSENTWSANYSSPGAGRNTFYAFSDGSFQWNGGNPLLWTRIFPTKRTCWQQSMLMLPVMK